VQSLCLCLAPPPPKLWTSWHIFKKFLCECYDLRPPRSENKKRENKRNRTMCGDRWKKKCATFVFYFFIFWCRMLHMNNMAAARNFNSASSLIAICVIYPVFPKMNDAFGVSLSMLYRRTILVIGSFSFYRRCKHAVSVLS